MIRYDYHIAVAAFVAALLMAPLIYWIGQWAFVPDISFLGLAWIAATTINLMHQRRIEHNAGEPLKRRVHKILADDIEGFEARMKLLVKDMDDLKESQIRIAGQFRGRNMP